MGVILIKFSFVQAHLSFRPFRLPAKIDSFYYIIFTDTFEIEILSGLKIKQDNKLISFMRLFDLEVS